MIGKQVRIILHERKCDALVLFGSDENYQYVVGRKMDSSVLVFPKKGRPIILTNPLEFTKGLSFIVKKERNVLKETQKLLKQRKIKTIGINESETSVVQYRVLRSFRPKDVKQDLDVMRSVKTMQELVKIRKACKITVNIFHALIKGLRRKQFQTEEEILLFLKQKALFAGCELAFEPIVASGSDSRNPHYQGKKRLRKGFLVVDFGVKWKGYCSDVTRTFFIGMPTLKERLQYDTVRSALEGAIAFVRMGIVEGVEGSDVDAYAREALGIDAKYFIHALGHGIGLEVHEYPSISKRKGHPLKEGMVLAIEPGIYKESGVRIEDDIYLGKNVNVLTEGLTRDLLYF